MPEDQPLCNESNNLRFLNEFAPIWIHHATNGDKEAARTLAYLIARNLQSGKLPPILACYVLEGFTAIANGESADRALYLQHRPGKKDISLFKKVEIAFEVRRLYWTGEAKTIREACEKVSERGNPYHVSVETAYKYYYHVCPGPPERRPSLRAKTSEDTVN